MKTKILAMGVLSVMLATGCASTANNTQMTQNQKSVLGGAALGAAIGALSQTDDGNRKDIGKAAAIGAAVGAGAGYATTKVGQ